jgi:hypothetical protein
VLHVLNGHATASVFDRAGIAGGRLVWRDILVEGPVPTVAYAPLPGRAAFLAERLGLDAAEYTRAAAEQISGLAAALRTDEIVLWFEQDLFCAVTLWSLLDWLARRAPTARASLVYPPGDADARGLGAFEPSKLAALFAARQPVTETTSALGVRAWAVYASPDPMAAQALGGREAAHLPFLDGALRCHLGRFPSVATGLNEVETVALDVLARGRRGFAELFREVSAHPLIVRHGMGDVQLAACLRGLGPLVRADGDGHEITARGRAVAAGDEDWLAIQPIDTWLGGVHLRRDRPLWRWDALRGRLVSAPS